VRCGGTKTSSPPSVATPPECSSPRPGVNRGRQGSLLEDDAAVRVQLGRALVSRTLWAAKLVASDGRMNVTNERPSVESDEETFIDQHRRSLHLVGRMCDTTGAPPRACVAREKGVRSAFTLSLRLPPPRWAFSSHGPCPHQGSCPYDQAAMITSPRSVPLAALLQLAGIVVGVEILFDRHRTAPYDPFNPLARISAASSSREWIVTRSEATG
jgi:hypothetical protein